MDKPVSLSMKAWIIRNMSVRTATQESIIETVINHQFETALSAMDTVNSIEFSGFGKFFFNGKKAIRKLQKLTEQMEEVDRILNDVNATENKKRNAQIKLIAYGKNFQYLKNRLNDTEQSIRGMEKQTVSPQGTEGPDSEGERREDENL